MLLEVILAFVVACLFLARQIRAISSPKGKDYWKQRGIKYVVEYAEYRNRRCTL